MSPEFVLGFTKSALTTAMVVSGPVLTAGLTVGLTVAIFQAVTQIHEVSLTFIPKIVAMSLALFASAGWMLEHVLEFTRNAFSLMAMIGD